MKHTDDSPPVSRTLLGGVLMGLANLVPGISGGTMILAVGLYDRFIGAVADVTRLQFRTNSLLFLAILMVGVVGAIVSLSGVAVDLVSDHRWVMYSLFVGLTLGGAPQLVRLSRPLGPRVWIAALAGVGFMIAFALKLRGTDLPQTFPILIVVGAAAASSMILPGVSGSYVLLILGMYDLVIGHLSLGAWRADFAASAGVVVPVVIGAGLGIGLLSNMLRAFLARAPSLSHGLLLGLLLGSIVGLWPFQQPTDPELAHRPTRKAVTMLLAGEDGAAIRDEYGAEFDDERLVDLRARYGTMTPGDLKARADELEWFAPTGGQVGSALGLLALGFLLTLALGSREKPAGESKEDG